MPATLPRCSAWCPSNPNCYSSPNSPCSCLLCVPALANSSAWHANPVCLQVGALSSSVSLGWHACPPHDCISSHVLYLLRYLHTVVRSLKASCLSPLCTQRPAKCLTHGREASDCFFQCMLVTVSGTMTPIPWQLANDKLFFFFNSTSHQWLVGTP